MKFVTYREHSGATASGVLRDGLVAPLARAGFTDLPSLMSLGARATEHVSEWLASEPADYGIPLSEVSLLAPVPRPPKFICVGLNYRDHAIESGMAIPETPTIFSKFSSSVIGPGEPIVLPRVSSKPDYEAELAFVVGRGGRNIPRAAAMDHVFGYTIVNDVSARDYQMATSQWLMGKTFDTFAPMGPWIVSADEIADPHTLAISLDINGETLQNSNTRELIFKIPELVEFLSSVFTLEPGDIVSTGTPPGVGFARKPPRYLKPGDTVTVRVQGLGELTNPVVAEGQASAA